MLTEEDRKREKKKELATEAIWLKKSTKRELKRLRGIDYPDFTFDEIIQAFMDTHKREKRTEEVGED